MSGGINPEGEVGAEDTERLVGKNCGGKIGGDYRCPTGKVGRKSRSFRIRGLRLI